MYFIIFLTLFFFLLFLEMRIQYYACIFVKLSDLKNSFNTRRTFLIVQIIYTQDTKLLRIQQSAQYVASLNLP